MACTLLTDDEWRQIKPPFHYMRVKNSSWQKVHHQMIVKWLEEHCGAGFVYWDGVDTYVFGAAGDKILFMMWIKDDPFEDEGEIASA